MTQRIAIWRAVSSRRQAKKISLTDQERLGREWSEHNDGEVVAVLTVPGHSRREADVLDLFEDYATHGITAYHDLRKLWKTRGFDVLHAYDDSRFGRSATLATYVMENTLLSGASIYYHEGGWLKQEGGFRYRIAVGSAEAAGDIDKLVERSKMGKLDRAHKGLTNGSVPPLSHKVVRNPANGKSLRLEVDESLRRLWDDIADLLLQGVAWWSLGDELYQRGHIDERGKAYASDRIYKLVLNPVFWGNQGLMHRGYDKKKRNERGIWAFDPDVPRPENADMFYSTHPAVYEGEQAEAVKRELRRRSMIMRGKARPGHTRLFTGLAVCGVCWHTMETATSKGWLALRCGQRWNKRKATPCPNTKMISEKRVKEYFNVRIEKVLKGQPVEDFADLVFTSEVDRQIEQLVADIQRADERVRSAMSEQFSAETETLKEDYRSQAKIYDGQRLEMKQRLSDLQQTQLEQARWNTDAKAALKFIEDVGLEPFWNLEMRVINQTLFNLMCNRQMVVFNGEIKGTRPRQKWNRHTPV